jgi:hypothetical protein
VQRVRERRRGGRRRKGMREKKKGKKKKVKEREKREKDRELPAGFAVAVASACRCFGGKQCTRNEEKRDGTVIGTGAGTADRREGFREIKILVGKRFGMI